MLSKTKEDCQSSFVLENNHGNKNEWIKNGWMTLLHFSPNKTNSTGDIFHMYDYLSLYYRSMVTSEFEVVWGDFLF